MAEKFSATVGDAPGQKVRFGNFEIVNDSEGRPLALGKGTFGRTYQARHCFLDTIVALKIITERYAADAAVRQRFLIEARAVAKLSHPHVARLYDFGEMDGVLHYAMEYCGGGSLADYVAKHGPLGLRQLLEVAQQIAGALKCAHAAGFIHRDLKPSNIMLTEESEPLFTKLIDFGLVQPSVPGATRTLSDDQSADGARFLGTPLFASPEQLREEPMDVRTDLFSLGMTLWYLALGAPPESGSSAAIAASRLGSESYSSRLPANMPPQLRDVLSKLLEKDRNKRFSSASDVFGAFNLCAGSLGFRRARDYTDPRAELSEWEEEELRASAGPKTTQVKPIEIQHVNAELSSEFNIVARINEDFTGLNYIVAPAGSTNAGLILHVLHPTLLEDSFAFNNLRVHLARLSAWEGPELIRPQSLKKYSDYTTVILEKPAGTDLMSILRTERTVQLIEAAPLLEQIADACDALSSAGLPGVQLAPARVFVEWDTENGAENKRLNRARPKLYPRFLAVSEAPDLARMNEPEDASSTMTTDMLSDPGRADNMPEHFGTLLYRVVAGRNCPMAAGLSSQAYVAIPGLSEHSNRLLSLVIAKQIASTSCGQILREILGAEGVVPRIPGHPSAGFTAGSGTGSTVSPITPPPVNRTINPPLATPTVTPAPAARWRPPAITPPPIPTPIVPRQEIPVVPPAPPPVSLPPLAPERPTSPPVVTAKEQPAPTIFPVEAKAPIEKASPPLEKAPPVPDILPPAPKAEPPATKMPVVDKAPPPMEPVLPQIAEAKVTVPPPEPIKPAPKEPEKAVPVAPPKSEPIVSKTPAREPVAAPVEKTVSPIAEGKAAAPPPEKGKPVAKEPEKIIPAPTPKVEPVVSKAPASVEAPLEKRSPATAEGKPAAPPVEKAKPTPRPVEKVSDKEVAPKPAPSPRILPAEIKPAAPVLAKTTADKIASQPPSLPALVVPTKTVRSLLQDAQERFRFETLWGDRRLRAAAIVVASLMLITVSYGFVRHFSTGAGPGKAVTKVAPQPSTASVSAPVRPTSSAPPAPVTAPSAAIPTPNAEQNRDAQLLAEQEAAAAAARQRKAEEAKIAAEQESSARARIQSGTLKQPSPATDASEGTSTRTATKHRSTTGSESTKPAGGSRVQSTAQRSGPPPAPPPPAKASRPAASKSEGRRPTEFEGTRPGG
jgi:serine/threonine protein kinase